MFKDEFSDDELPTYETRPRKRRNFDEVQKITQKLPIKVDGKLLASGRLNDDEATEVNPKQKLVDQMEKSEELVKESEVKRNIQNNKADGRNKERTKIEPWWKQLLNLNEEQLSSKLDLVKVEIATLCQEILEDPQKSLTPPPNDSHKLLILIQLCRLDHSELKKLCILSAVAVLKDIIPEYKISVQLKNTDLKSAKLKKDVKRQWRFEKELLSCYESFVSLLFSFCGGKKNKLKTGKLSKFEQRQLKIIAVRSICTLLVAKPNFNHREKLLKEVISILISRAGGREIETQCAGCLNSLFSSDPSCEITLEAVAFAARLCSKAAKTGKAGKISQRFIECTLNCKLSADMKDDRRYKEAKEMAKKRKRKSKQNDKAFLSMSMADAVESFDIRFSRQTEALRELFLIYLRILKLDPNENRHLLPITLKAISKYIGLINLDLVQDLVKVLLDLLKSGKASAESSLRAIHCVAGALQGPAQQLRLDETGFVLSLFKILNSAILLDESDLFEDTINGSGVLALVECIEVLFLRQVDQPLSRVSRLINLLSQLTFHARPNETLCLVSLIRFLLNKYNTISSSLCDQLFESEVEKKQNGAIIDYNNVADSSTSTGESLWSICNILFSTHPDVAKHAKMTLTYALKSTSPGKVIAPKQSERPFVMFNNYNPRKGGFNPPIQKEVISKASKKLNYQVSGFNLFDQIISQNFDGPSYQEFREQLM